MKIRNAFVLALAVTAGVTVTGCGHLMMMHGKGVPRPAATEFGTGPRASAARQFTATLQPDPRAAELGRTLFFDTCLTCWSARSRYHRCATWPSARPTCTPAGSTR